MRSHNVPLTPCSCTWYISCDFIFTMNKNSASHNVWKMCTPDNGSRICQIIFKVATKLQIWISVVVSFTSVKSALHCWSSLWIQERNPPSCCQLRCPRDYHIASRIRGNATRPSFHGTLYHGGAFSITGPLWEESSGHRWESYHK